MRDYKFIIIYFLTFVFTQLVLWIINWPGKVTMAIFIPFAFSVYQIIQFGVSVFRRKYFLGMINLLIFMLMFLWCIKIHFIFYNIGINFFLIGLSTVILLLKRNISDSELKDKIYKTLLPVAILSLVILCVSDTYLFKLFVGKTSKPYTDMSEICWNDFQGGSIKEKLNLDGYVAYADAQINSTFRFKVNEVYNYPRIISIAVIDTEKSWTSKYSESLLKHERVHSGISLYFSHRVNELNKYWTWQTESLIEKADQLHDSLIVTQEQFDRETLHGTVRNKENEWEERITKMLE